MPRVAPRSPLASRPRARAALVLAGALGVLGAAPDAVAEARAPLRDDRCATPPTVAPAGFRHRRSGLIARVGSPNHRGIDVLALHADAAQRVAGKLAYGKADKDVEDEDAHVFACVDGAWRPLGTARTDDDGRFAVTLEGARRLPAGMRDLYVAADGDGTGAYFVAYVARPGERIVVTDVDGTITWSENAIIRTAIRRGTDIAPRPNAPAGLSAIPHVVVYVTARGDVFTEITRRWLARHGFPRGVMRLSRGAFARPGTQAIAYKTSVLRAFTIPIAAGIGNRESDIVAYTNVGLQPAQILIHLPQFEREVRDDLAAGRAVGFADYAHLPSLLLAGAAAP